MKQLLLLAVVGAFSLSIVGCHASAGPTDSSDSHYKKSTTRASETKTTTN
jgi:hypothetical protein